MSKFTIDTISAMGVELDESRLARVAGGKAKAKEKCEIIINTETCQPEGPDVIVQG
ncbi:putative ATP-grasp target RiPP [Rhodococcus sp. SMB37]|uniref:putative ATP-grasp target RiPP n=1 Tax=Rhodococcus sp. SMB37 TaxID=2512213 RepID=UPI000B2D9C2E|nr:putative ATP-grasp target RiPP [Rhodococcus sp. SMB37]TCN48195.1 putative ATP-grasp target RiPP [Rhodococcus sp. SMB37]